MTFPTLIKYNYQMNSGQKMKFSALIFLFSAICLASCAALRTAAPQVKTAEKSPEEVTKTLTPAEQGEKAEPLYYEFLQKYPDSGVKTPVEDALSQSYHKNAKWEKLIAIPAQAVDDYSEKDRIPSPEPLFMYAEAKLYTGSIEDAEKYYKAVINSFLSSSSFRATVSKKRLEGIANKRAKQT
jgi:tetratricopeptide (TPR) repeat protein